MQLYYVITTRDRNREKKKGEVDWKKKVIAIFLRQSECKLTHIAANTKRIQFPSDFRRADELMLFEPNLRTRCRFYRSWNSATLFHAQQRASEQATAPRRRESIQGAVTFLRPGDRGIPLGTLGRKNNLVPWSTSSLYLAILRPLFFLSLSLFLFLSFLFSFFRSFYRSHYVSRGTNLNSAAPRAF